jgi:Protein of unknown function (DUF2628)
MAPEVAMEEELAPLEQFIGSEARNYYIPTFQTQKLAKRRIGWNWPAFFFGPIWFAYRKLYLEAILFTCVFFLVSYYEYTEKTELAKFHGGTIFLTMALLAGLYGNYRYRQRVGRELMAIDKVSDSGEDRAAERGRRGGTNGWAALVFFVLFVLSESPALWK